MAQQYGTSENITARLAGPFGSGGAVVKLTEIHLPLAAWKGAESPYVQTATAEGISVGSKVDLQLSGAQLEAFHEMDIAFTTENDGGSLTVYAIGDKPRTDLTLQATITEVIA